LTHTHTHTQVYKSLVLFSGGLDSTVVAAMLQKAGAYPLLLSLNLWGQEKVVESQNRIACLLGLKLTRVDMRDVLDKLQIPGSNYIPGFKLFQYSLALAMAEKIGVEKVYTGEMDADTGGSGMNDPATKDFTNEFLGGVFDTMDSSEFRGEIGSLYNDFTPYHENHPGTAVHFGMIDALAGLDKAAVVRLGRALGAPLETTVSCFQNSKSDHCGGCFACRGRHWAFMTAEGQDSTEYDVKPKELV